MLLTVLASAVCSNSWRIGLRRYLRYNTEAFRPSFSEQYRGSRLQVLWSVHELEFDMSFVTRPQKLLVDIADLGSLTNDTAVYDCLVIRFYGCRVVQNYNLSFKVIYTLRVGVFV